MILKIPSEKYYGYNGKNKEHFKKKYRSLGLKWKVNINLDNVLTDGWYNSDNSIYLLKLLEDSGYKRFTGNSEEMILFLKSIGAEEFNQDVSGCHIDYDDNKGYITQQDRYGTFIGADLISGYRFMELLRDVPDNFGVVWGDNNQFIPIIKKRIIKRAIRR